LPHNSSLDNEDTYCVQENRVTLPTLLIASTVQLLITILMCNELLKVNQVRKLCNYSSVRASLWVKIIFFVLCCGTCVSCLNSRPIYAFQYPLAVVCMQSYYSLYKRQNYLLKGWSSSRLCVHFANYC